MRKRQRLEMLKKNNQAKTQGQAKLTKFGLFSISTIKSHGRMHKHGLKWQF